MDFLPQSGLLLLAFDITVLLSSFRLNTVIISDWMLAETCEFY